MSPPVCYQGQMCCFVTITTSFKWWGSPPFACTLLLFPLQQNRVISAFLSGWHVDLILPIDVKLMQLSSPCSVLHCAEFELDKFSNLTGPLTRFFFAGMVNMQPPLLFRIREIMPLRYYCNVLNHQPNLMQIFPFFLFSLGSCSTRIYAFQWPLWSAAKDLLI
jgi:hypothetical protein